MPGMNMARALMLASLVAVSAQVAKADQVVTTETVTTSPGYIVNSPVLQTVEPTMRRRSVIMQTKPAARSSFVGEIKFGPYENFARRLQLMGEQIDLGTQQGMLSSVQAAELMNRQARLQNLLSTVRAQAYAKPAADDLERQVNGLNIDLHHAMEGRGQVAGVGIIQ